MSLLTLKRSVRHALNHNGFYNNFFIYKTERKLRNFKKFGNPSFQEQVFYEYARKRLMSLPSGHIHPQNHFHDKDNQRRFMQAIGADLPKKFFAGDADGLSHLEAGRYFLKPLRGSSAKGAIPISVDDDRIEFKGKKFPLSVFFSWYKTTYGTNRIIVEECLEDRFFDSLVDYKAYCFFGTGPDHVLCMQRNDMITAATYSPEGEKIFTGKYASSPMHLEIQKDIIKEIALRADKLARQIPLSFVRLDFFVSRSGIFLGEVTPLPGRSEDFSKEKNQDLGRKWLDARKSISLSVKDTAGYAYFLENRLEIY